MDKNLTFKVIINIGNDTMKTNDDLIIALTQIKEKLYSGTIEGKIQDTNGNSVGVFGLSRE
jgi:hypothetical protein